MTVLRNAELPLAAGDVLGREEFLRRWEASPEIKKAELIGGVVYMPPVGVEHGDTDSGVNYVLKHYALHTLGCQAGSNATLHLLEDAPQPDAHLRLLREYGGSSWVERGFLHGAPELIAETARSSTSYDLHQKKDLYEAARVKEYIVILYAERRMLWHRLVGRKYQVVPASPDGIIRSSAFPGLWLEVQAFLKDDMARVLDVLNAGLKSEEHEELVRQLRSMAPGGDGP